MTGTGFAGDIDAWKAWDEKFWTRWRTAYARVGIGNDFCFDGPGDEYWTTTPRVLFLLKEPNQAKGGADMRHQLRKGPEHGIWYAVARWGVGILHGAPFPPKEMDKEHLKSSMRRIAAINLKKAIGGAQADARQLHVAAHRDRDLLGEQIRALAPHLVVACGTFEPLIWLLDLHPDPRNLGAAVRGEGGVLVLPWRHPARSTGEHYLELGRKIATLPEGWAAPE
jgi:hypothetical protein